MPDDDDDLDLDLDDFTPPLARAIRDVRNLLTSGGDTLAQDERRKRILDALAAGICRSCGKLERGRWCQCENDE